MPQTTPIEPAESLLAATLLAATGGLLDAFVYLNHGHVFANAMTGNVVLLGIALTTGDLHQALRHITPLCAFLAGVFVARFIHDQLGRNAAIAGLTLEIAVLFAVSLFPLTFPQMAFTAIVAFVSAFQITSFRRAGSFSYNSTFVTGNLRDVALGVYDRFAAPSLVTRTEGGSHAFHLGLVCLFFLIGACLGAWAGPHLANHTLWLAEPFLLTVVALHLGRKAVTQPS